MDGATEGYGYGRLRKMLGWIIAQNGSIGKFVVSGRQEIANPISRLADFGNGSFSWMVVG
jgi:hypothetical protein